MRWPWERTDDERRKADADVAAVRSHLRILVLELQDVTARIGAKVANGDR